MEYSRRGFTGWMLAVLLRAQPGNTATMDTRTVVKRYRADAVILLLGIPIFKRPGVGSGQVSVEEAGEGPQATRTLFFAAGSDPKRAHGLARLGWMREISRAPGAAPAETEYFGVMTSSPEESLDNARKSVDATPGARSLFVAVKGRHAAGRSRSALAQFEFASDAAWSDRGLIETSQSAFSPASVWRENAWPKWPEQPPPTFLFQLEALLKQRAKRIGTYIYNEQEYQIELAAPQQSDHLLAVKGSIRNQRTGIRTAFRVWLENTPGSVVPVRIEFQPRSSCGSPSKPCRPEASSRSDVLIHQDRIPVWVNHDKARRPRRALVRLSGHLHALRFQLPLEFTHVRERGQFFGVAIPARIESQDVLLEQTLK